MLNIVMASLDACMEYSLLQKNKDTLKEIEQAVLHGIDETMEYDLIKKLAENFVEDNPAYRYILFFLAS